MPVWDSRNTQSLQFMRNEEDYLLTFGGRPYMSIFSRSFFYKFAAE